MAARTQADFVLSWLLADHTVAQAARLLGVARSTVARWQKTGVPANRAEAVAEQYGQGVAYEALDVALVDAQECTRANLGGAPLATVARNKDGSLDAQLTVFEIPRGVAVYDAIAHLSVCCRALANTFNTFVQVGMRWGARGGADKVPDSGDRRYRGLAEGSTYYYGADRLGTVFDHAVRVAENVARRHRRKVETVFVRVHWNPAGVAPASWNPRKPVYRAYKRKEPKPRKEKKQ